MVNFFISAGIVLIMIVKNRRSYHGMIKSGIKSAQTSGIGTCYFYFIQFFIPLPTGSLNSFVKVPAGQFFGYIIQGILNAYRRDACLYFNYFIPGSSKQNHRLCLFSFE